MKNKKNKEKIICDCCGTKLSKSENFEEDNPDHDTYIKREDIDLCFICAGKIFNVYYKNSLSEQDLFSKIKEIKNIK